MDAGRDGQRACVEAFVPLAAPDLTGNELKYVTECIKSGYVTHAGRFEREFERAFSERFNIPALATSSGTGALHLALLSLGIGPGDEVIVPALTFGATAAVVLAVGAKPVIVDIEPGTWGLDRNRVLAVLNKKTRAIIPVHLYGEDAGSFRQFGIPVVEDACESLGMVPAQGDITCYSFYGNKVITTGEGGMLCGNYGEAQKWRDGGFDGNYRSLLPGLNYRMSNMQAAVGLAQLERLDDLLGMRQRNAQRYAESLPGKGKWLFCVETQDPQGLQAHLKEEGIDSRPIFNPLHLSPAFRVYAKGKYRVAEQVWQTHLSLPTGPHLQEEQQEKVISCVTRYIRRTASSDCRRAA